MPYTIPGFAAIRQRMLRDAANLDPTAPQDRDSDLYVRSSATASAVSGLYDFLAWQARQLLPDTADPEYLEQHCALRGITRKAATRATGTLTLTGRTGAVVPAGTQAKDLSGVLYRSTAGATLSGAAEAATAAVPCEAVDAGALPDLDDAPVTLLAAPSGVQSAARLTLAGGSDAEDDATLLARLLEYMRNPPSGGTAADYRRWAREVPGVADAQVYPLRQGAGSARRGRCPGLPAAAGRGHSGCGHHRPGRYPRRGRGGRLSGPYQRRAARDGPGHSLRPSGPVRGHDPQAARGRFRHSGELASRRAGRP